MQFVKKLTQTQVSVEVLLYYKLIFSLFLFSYSYFQTFISNNHQVKYGVPQL